MQYAFESLRWKDPSKENKLLFKTQRNECVLLRRKRIKTFKMLQRKVTNKSFRKFVRPFLTNKNCHTQNDIILIDDGKVIVDEHELVETFNDHYVNIVGKFSEEKPRNYVSDTNLLDDVLLTNSATLQ